MGFMQKLSKVGRGVAADLKKYQADAPKREKAKIQKMKQQVKMARLENQLLTEKQKLAKARQQAGPQFGFNTGPSSPFNVGIGPDTKKKKDPFRF